MSTKTTFERGKLWRFYLELFIVVFFILLSTIEVLAQDNVLEKRTENEKVTTYEIQIESTILESELREEIPKMLKDEFGISATISGISRTKEGEINSIRIVLTHKIGLARNYAISGSAALKPFSIFITTDNNKRIDFGFKTTTAQPDKEQAVKTVNLQVLNDERTLRNKLSPQELKSYESLFDGSPINDSIYLGKEKRVLDYNTAFLSVNGKEATVEEFLAVELESISEIMAYNILSEAKLKEENLLERFGPKARNGVLAIKTSGKKKIFSKGPKNMKGAFYKVDANNCGCIITKDLADEDFDFCIEELKLVGLQLTISNVIRNPEGIITSLNIDLFDEQITETKSANSLKLKNAGGIPDLIIGRKKGQLLLNPK
jgi:hypothetical protein